MRRANRCEACERAEVIVRGGRCPLHESSTSPIVDRRGRAPERIGPLGPVPIFLAGGGR